MLNPREQAIVIWLMIFIIYALLIKDVRKTIPGLIKSLFRLLRHPIFIITSIYILVIFSIMFFNKIMELGVIKDYIIWIIFGLFPVIFQVTTKYFEVNIRKIFIETFKFSIIPLFIINEYTLSIWIELFIVPILIIIGAMLAIADTDEKYKSVKKILNYILMIMGLVFFIVAVNSFIANVIDALKIEFWEKMFIDIIGIILHIPLLLLIQIMSVYEQVIVRTNINTRLDKIRVAIYLFHKYKFKTKFILKLFKNYKLRQVNNIKEFKNILYEELRGVDIGRVGDKD